jgi:DNA repair protein SbcC/Rad50
VMDGLDMLRSQGRTICVISHVEAMKERFSDQVLVEKQGGGRSTVRWAHAA